MLIISTFLSYFTVSSFILSCRKLFDDFLKKVKILQGYKKNCFEIQYIVLIVFVMQENQKPLQFRICFSENF